jgi:hypothetical protein
MKKNKITLSPSLIGYGRGLNIIDFVGGFTTAQTEIAGRGGPS